MAVNQHQVQTRPAPVGGINGRDPISAMPETDAVNLINWIPDDIGLRIRKGYSEWAINVPGGVEVKSLLSWIGPATAFPGGSFLTAPTSVPGKLFAVTDAAVYDISNSTNAPASVRSMGAASQSGRCKSAMLSNTAGAFLLVASESDGYFYYDGTNWTTPTFGGGAGQVSGCNPSLFVDVLIWKRRAWFVERNSTSAWYLPTDSITGAAVELDFGPIFTHGGHLSYLAKWTIDAGEGIDDFLVAVSSNGDVAVYKGTDPSSSSTFQLVGTWYIGQIPIGRRGYCQYGGDLILISADGINPISYVTRGGSSILGATGKEYSSKIRTILGQALRESFTSYGWELMLHPTERLLIVNTPNSSSGNSRQFALSTGVNQWTTFQGIPISCMDLSTGYAFAGTADGRVLLLFNGWQDNVLYGESQGDGIRGVVQPAFSTFGAPSLTKHFLMARPCFLAQDTPNFLCDISVNYSVTEPLGTPAFFATQQSLWDVDNWDSAVWGGGLNSFSEWVGVRGLGYAGAAGLVTFSTGEIVLTAIDYMYSVGGPL